MPREERDKVAAAMLEAWVRRFEHYCLGAPMQWFNFYDFYGDGLRTLERSSEDSPTAELKLPHSGSMRLHRSSRARAS